MKLNLYQFQFCSRPEVFWKSIFQGIIFFNFSFGEKKVLFHAVSSSRIFSHFINFFFSYGKGAYCPSFCVRACENFSVHLLYFFLGISIKSPNNYSLWPIENFACILYTDVNLQAQFLILWRRMWRPLSTVVFMQYTIHIGANAHCNTNLALLPRPVTFSFIFAFVRSFFSFIPFSCCVLSKVKPLPLRFCGLAFVSSLHLLTFVSFVLKKKKRHGHFFLSFWSWICFPGNALCTKNTKPPGFSHNCLF